MRKILPFCCTLVLLCSFALPVGFAATEKPAYSFSQKEFADSIRKYSNEDLLLLVASALQQLQENQYMDKETLHLFRSKLEYVKRIAEKQDKAVFSRQEIQKIYQPFVYKEFSRTPEKYTGDKFLVKGRIFYIHNRDGEKYYQLTTRNYTDAIWFKADFKLDSNFVIGDRVELCLSYTGSMMDFVEEALFTLDENTPIKIR